MQENYKLVLAVYFLGVTLVKVFFETFKNLHLLLVLFLFRALPPQAILKLVPTILLDISSLSPRLKVAVRVS